MKFNVFHLHFYLVLIWKDTHYDDHVFSFCIFCLFDFYTFWIPITFGRPWSEQGSFCGIKATTSILFIRVNHFVRNQTKKMHFISFHYIDDWRTSVDTGQNLIIPSENSRTTEPHYYVYHGLFDDLPGNNWYRDSYNK